jgi:valine--pyruvate aminotransferase
MNPFSNAGERLAGPSGIQELMDDLGEALSVRPRMRMLGGGQPAAIPEVQALWREGMQRLLADGAAFDRMLLNYDPPAGSPAFREAMAAFLSRECGWAGVGMENIAVLPGSQTAMFMLFNLLAGESAGGLRRILFPLVPEYIGYAGQGLAAGQMQACLPRIETRGVHEFKYRVDFDALRLTPDIAAMCVSCPTNPSGNVLTEEEFQRLGSLARAHGIPLILDCAYGHPFPGVVHGAFTPAWEPGMIFSLSLSKLGLPGTRTSIIVADAPLVKALSNMNAIVALANGNVGQALLTPLLADDRLLRLGREVIRPWYQKRSDQAVEILSQALGSRADWALHAREGAFFLWLWIKGLKVPAAELYRRLKQRDVLVIPGHYFAYGLSEPWKHADECVRLTFSQPEPVVREGLEILADEVAQIQG